MKPVSRAQVREKANGNTVPSGWQGREGERGPGCRMQEPHFQLQLACLRVSRFPSQPGWVSALGPMSTYTSGLCPSPCPSLFQVLLSPRPTWPVGIRPQCVFEDSTWGGACTVLGPQCRLSTCWQRGNTKRCVYQMSKGLRTHLFQRFPHSTEFTEMPPVHLLQPSTRMWKWLRLTC